MFDIPYDVDNSQERLQARPPRTLNRIKFTNKHQQLREKLAPLANIQRFLEEQLDLARLDLHSTSVDTTASLDREVQCSSLLSQCRGLQEFSVYSSNGWKSALNRPQSFRHNGSSQGLVESWGSGSTLALSKESDREDEIALELAMYQRDIKELWEDDIVREVLSRRKVRLEDTPGL